MERLEIHDTKIEWKLVSLALLAVLPVRVQKSGKKPTKKYPLTLHPPLAIDEAAKGHVKDRTKLRKKVKRSARDGNIGGDWGSKQSRHAKLAKALKSEKMASKSEGKTSAPRPQVRAEYTVATISRMLKNVGLFCKRALQKRPIFCKEKYIFKRPTNRSHPIPGGEAYLYQSLFEPAPAAMQSEDSHRRDGGRRVA